MHGAPLHTPLMLPHSCLYVYSMVADITSSFLFIVPVPPMESTRALPQLQPTQTSIDKVHIDKYIDMEHIEGIGVWTKETGSICSIWFDYILFFRILYRMVLPSRTLYVWPRFLLGHFFFARSIPLNQFFFSSVEVYLPLSLSPSSYKEMPEYNSAAQWFVAHITNPEPFNVADGGNKTFQNLYYWRNENT